MSPADGLLRNEGADCNQSKASLIAQSCALTVGGLFRKEKFLGSQIENAGQ